MGTWFAVLNIELEGGKQEGREDLRVVVADAEEVKATP
jgi:hypothetical protein